jgi:DDE superfamily endonuclease
VVQRLVAAYPLASKIHLVMDNLNIHCRKSLTDHLGNQQGRYIWSRLKVHYTPKHGSWLNQAEIAMPGDPPHSHTASIGGQRHCLERQGQPQSDLHSMEFHSQGGSREVRLPKEYF